MKIWVFLQLWWCVPSFFHRFWSCWHWNYLIFIKFLLRWCRECRFLRVDPCKIAPVPPANWYFQPSYNLLSVHSLISPLFLQVPILSFFSKFLIFPFLFPNSLEIISLPWNQNPNLFWRILKNWHFLSFILFILLPCR